MDEIQNIYMVYLTVSGLVKRYRKYFAREKDTGKVVLARKKCTNKSIIGRRNNMLMGPRNETVECIWREIQIIHPVKLIIQFSDIPLLAIDVYCADLKTHTQIVVVASSSKLEVTGYLSKGKKSVFHPYNESVIKWSDYYLAI